jgi:tetratricopeptide (TPR) repeat protein
MWRLELSPKVFLLVAVWSISSGIAFAKSTNDLTFRLNAAAGKESFFGSFLHADEVSLMIGFASVLLKSEGTAADPQNAERFAEQIAEADLQRLAGSALGNYYRGIGEYGKALRAFQQAADAGEGWAMFGLAEMLLKGEGTAADPQKAIKLLEQAAVAGLTGPTGNALGNYYRGIGEYGKALRAFQQAADAGEGWAMIGLAEMLLKGEGTQVSRDKARILLENALEQKKIAFAYVGLIALAAEQFRSGNAISPTLSLLRDAYVADPTIALNSVNWLPNNSKVAVIQSLLRDAALYSGPTDGLLTAATVRAIRRFCTRKNIRECSVNALPAPFLQALLPALGTDDPVSYFRSSERRLNDQQSRPLKKKIVRSTTNAKQQSTAVVKQSAAPKKKPKKITEASTSAKQQSTSVMKQSAAPKKKPKKITEANTSAKQQSTSVMKQSAAPKKKPKKITETSTSAKQQSTSVKKQSAPQKDKSKEATESNSSPRKCYVVSGVCRPLSRKAQKIDQSF